MNKHETQSGVTLTSQVYGRLYEDIIAGKLEPGTKLKVEELRELYNTGASAVREALSQLSSDRLVDRFDRRGFRVAGVSDAEFRDLLNARCWIEERALREAISRGQEAWEENIVLCFYRLSKDPRSMGSDGVFSPNPAWEVHHKAFHMALLADCGSPILLGYSQELYDKNVRYRNLAAPSAYPGRDTQSEHQAIMEATLAREADKAVQLLLEHYRKTGAFLEI